MDSRSPPLRPDVVSVQTEPRPTATPVRVHFSEVLAGGAQALVRGAQAAVRALPGSPLAAVAVRGAASGVPSAWMSLGRTGTASVSVAAMPEGPGGGALGNGIGAVVGVSGAGVGAAAAPGASDPNIEGSLAQAQEMNLYYLQIQEEVNAQNRTFTALSNVLEVEHNTAKSAIGNIH
jgi:hypothetical protein